MFFRKKKAMARSSRENSGARVLIAVISLFALLYPSGRWDLGMIQYDTYMLIGVCMYFSKKIVCKFALEKKFSFF